MPKFKILAPVLHAGAIHRNGEIELPITAGERLISLKAVEAIEEPNTANQNGQIGTDHQLDPQTLELLENMDDEELKEYAAAKEIDLGRATSRDGIFDKIKAALMVHDR